MSSIEWHVPGENLRRYADGALAPPTLWSTDAHLARCAHCRERLTGALDPELLRLGWLRVDAALDAPVPGPVERLLLWFGVADHTGRLLAATPILRLSWLAAVVSTLTLTIALAHVAHPLVFLAVAPILPLVGVAASYGPGIDPTHEIALVAPVHTFRLLLLRAAAVLTVTTAASGVASLGVPAYGLRVLGWFLPALALTLLSLALTPRLGPVGSVAAVGLGWGLLLVSTLAPGDGRSVVFTSGGQLAVALAAAMAAALLLRVRPAFDQPRRIDRAPRLGTRRMP